MSTRKIVRFPDKSIPVLEKLNLKVVVSSVKPTEPFRYLTRAIFRLQWASNTILFTNFGGDGALTKGLQIKYDGRLILPTGLTSINDFSHIAYDSRIDSDASVTKVNQLVSRFSIWKFTRNGQGLFMGTERELSIEVQDDLSGSANTEIEVILQGWRV